MITCAPIATTSDLWRALKLAGAMLALSGVPFTCASLERMGCREVDGEVRNRAFEIGKSLELYKLQHGAYPTSEQGLEVLVSPPKGKPLMERVPKDAWGEEFIYVIPGQKNPSKLYVRSKGPDREAYTDDDVGNWPEEE